MKVFISWSGDLSQRVGLVLRDLLPDMLHGVEVFMSKHDIGSGVRWNQELGKELEQSNFGILVLTRQNLSEPWLLFEAGAISKHAEARAVGLLVGGLSPTDVEAPLSQFQHRRFDEEDLRALIHDLNALREESLSPERMDRIFAKWWSELESKYREALETAEDGSGHPPARRDERELLEEILLRVRDLGSTRGREAAAFPGDLASVLSRPVTFDSLAWYTLWKFPGKPVKEALQSVLLRDLDQERYSRIADIDCVVESAKAAVSAYAKENPDWFRYGTDYITKSLGFVDREFRARHGFAARTREAFERLEPFVNDDGGE